MARADSPGDSAQPPQVSGGRKVVETTWGTCHPSGEGDPGSVTGGTWSGLQGKGAGAGLANVSSVGLSVGRSVGQKHNCPLFPSPDPWRHLDPWTHRGTAAPSFARGVSPGAAALLGDLGTGFGTTCCVAGNRSRFQGFCITKKWNIHAGTATLISCVNHAPAPLGAPETHVVACHSKSKPRPLPQRSPRGGGREQPWPESP